MVSFFFSGLTNTSDAVTPVANFSEIIKKIDVLVMADGEMMGHGVARVKGTRSNWIIIFGINI